MFYPNLPKINISLIDSHIIFMIQKAQQYQYSFLKRQPTKKTNSNVEVYIEVTDHHQANKNIEELKKDRHLDLISSPNQADNKKRLAQADNHSYLRRYPIFSSPNHKHSHQKVWHIRRLQTQALQTTNRQLYNPTKQRRSIFNPETPSQKVNQSSLTLNTAKNNVEQKSFTNFKAQNLLHLRSKPQEREQKQLATIELKKAKDFKFEKTFDSYKRVSSFRNSGRGQSEEIPIEQPQEGQKNSHQAYLQMTKDNCIQPQLSSLRYRQKGRIEQLTQLKSYTKFRQYSHLIKPGNNAYPSYRSDHKHKRKYILPWVEDLSQRLYDYRFTNQKSMADKCRFSQQAKRQEFQRMVYESSLASKILTKQEINALFEEVKTWEPRQNWWKRIVDYGYSKRKRIFQYEQLSSSFQR